jgi:hypothetical protein
MMTKKEKTKWRKTYLQIMSGRFPSQRREMDIYIYETSKTPDIRTIRSLNHDTL